MSLPLTKEQCLQWVKTPTVNPLTGKTIQIDKGVFKNLLSECKSKVTLEEVNQVNPEMVTVLFPSGIKIPIKPKPEPKPEPKLEPKKKSKPELEPEKWYEWEDFKKLLSMNQDYSIFKHYKEKGFSLSVDPSNTNDLLINYKGKVVKRLYVGPYEDSTTIGIKLHSYFENVMAYVFKLDPSYTKDLYPFLSLEDPSVKKYKDIGLLVTINPSNGKQLQIHYKGKIIGTVEHETHLYQTIYDLQSALEKIATEIQKPKWFESEDMKPILSLQTDELKKFKDFGFKVSIDPKHENYLEIELNDELVSSIEVLKDTTPKAIEYLLSSNMMYTIDMMGLNKEFEEIQPISKKIPIKPKPQPQSQLKWYQSPQIQPILALQTDKLKKFKDKNLSLVVDASNVNSHSLQILINGNEIIGLTSDLGLYSDPEAIEDQLHNDLLHNFSNYYKKMGWKIPKELTITEVPIKPRPKPKTKPKPETKPKWYELEVFKPILSLDTPGLGLYKSAGLTLMVDPSKDNQVLIYHKDKIVGKTEIDPKNFMATLQILFSALKDAFVLLKSSVVKEEPKLEPKWYELAFFKPYLSLDAPDFKKYKDMGMTITISPTNEDIVQIHHAGIIVATFERSLDINKTIADLKNVLSGISDKIEAGEAGNYEEPNLHPIPDEIMAQLQPIVDLETPKLAKYAKMGFEVSHGKWLYEDHITLSIRYKGKYVASKTINIHEDIIAIENQLETLLKELFPQLGITETTSIKQISEPTKPIEPTEPIKPTELPKLTEPVKSIQSIKESQQPTNKDMQLSQTEIGKNTFKIPSGVNFKVSKLTQQNKTKLAQQAVKTLISEQELVDQIKTDDFITKLLVSERRLLEYKLIQYTKTITQTETALNDPLLKIPPKPPQGGEPAEDLVSTLKKKLQSLQENSTILKDRHKVLETISTLLIEDKRKKINDILNHPENGIKTLIGEAREEIKKALYTQIVTFSKAPELYVNRFNNYTLMGGAGAGKTKLAGVLGNFFYNLGILNSNRVIIVTRADLVGKYIGQTGPITRKYLESTLEGVLFIDEAYQLSGCPDQNGNFSTKDFGSESITEIVNYIDKNIGLSVIIAAGYEDKITDCFLKVNEGMKRRFPNNLRLLDYTSKDLADILFYTVKKIFDTQILTDSQMKYISKVIAKLNEGMSPNGNKLFSNQAGDMLNLSNVVIQDLILNQKKGYKQTNINDTFTKFFMNKGYQIIIKHVSKT